MKQKTITYINEHFPETVIPKVGDLVVLYSLEPEGSDAVQWRISRDLEGIGGNMDKKIKRLHGWRGTTCGVGKYAHGLRKVLKVSEYRKGDIDYVKVTVGPDLAPEKD